MNTNIYSTGMNVSNYKKTDKEDWQLVSVKRLSISVDGSYECRSALRIESTAQNKAHY